MGGAKELAGSGAQAGGGVAGRLTTHDQPGRPVRLVLTRTTRTVVLASFLVGFAVCVALALSAGRANALEPVGTPYRVSHIGIDGDPGSYGGNPDVAGRSLGLPFIVVWQGGDTGAPPAGDVQIFARLFDSAGNPTTPQIQISDPGPPGDGNFVAHDPAVVYSNGDDQYLIVWEGTGPSGTNPQIFAQRLGLDGVKVGTPIAVTDSAGFYSAQLPDVAYNNSAPNYLIPFVGRKTSSSPPEIYAQDINLSGNRVGTDFAVSQLATGGQAAAVAPTVAYRSFPSNDYTIVFAGRTSASDQVPKFLGSERDPLGAR